ncbi:DUF6585 family protein [Streptomyces sp. TLI_171]|uniref:DUF6585 family protein n=1 Tax=Streptomyces sp. TLI_171 TaxID=1938859 RepID=UPI000C195054|nr:DUF6585 family protein [Streptomyces sp. TLI_171]RKE20184.1 hypothetical protein BX266_3533 [Streptomyces sp. TLI_171]
MSGEVAALAAAEGLGELRASFLPKRASGGALFGLGLLCLVGLALFVLPGVFFIWRLMKTPNLNGKEAAKRIHCFEHGLVASDRSGRPVAFRWDAMTVLQEITRRYVNGVYTGTRYKYTLVKQDGALELTGFYADPEVWGVAIQHEVTRVQLPGVLELLRQGGTARFGDITVNAGGMATVKRDGVSWGEIQRVEVKQGVVFVAKAGKLLAWSNTPVSKIPNFFVFLEVVDRLRSAHSAS